MNEGEEEEELLLWWVVEVTVAEKAMVVMIGKALTAEVWRRDGRSSEEEEAAVLKVGMPGR